MKLEQRGVSCFIVENVGGDENKLHDHGIAATPLLLMFASADYGEEARTFGYTAHEIRIMAMSETRGPMIADGMQAPASDIFYQNDSSLSGIWASGDTNGDGDEEQHVVAPGQQRRLD